MQDNKSQHSLTYRQDMLLPLFDLLQSAESCTVIGTSSIGKTRLIDFMMRLDVQKYYLKESAQQTLLVRVDMNRMSEWNEISFYELLMNSLALASGQKEKTSLLQQEFIGLVSKIILDRNELQSLRFVEFAAQKICQQHRLMLCFIFDEFDNAYQNLSRNVLANLRGIRDSNKESLSYMLFLRHLPHTLRSPAEIEGFYELVTRNIIGLKPCNHNDTLEIVQQFEMRRRHPIDSKTREWLYFASGGHPGIVQALFSLLIEYSEKNLLLEPPNWLIGQDKIKEECRKLWQSLSEEERVELANFVHGHPVSSKILDLLRLKGILQIERGNVMIFSLIFDAFIHEVSRS